MVSIQVFASRALTLVAGSLFAFAAPISTADACSVFSLHEDSVYVAKNYDWMPLHGHGAVFVNKRGVAKRAQTLRTKNALEWTSKFGSITFSQMGLEFPVSGINEAGLSAEILQLGETNHIPESDPRPALNEAQWLQFQLDNFATLNEVLDHVDNYRVEKAFLGVHYFVCDRTGECGIFEYLDGHLVVHSGSNLKLKVLTNSPYEQSVGSMKPEIAKLGLFPNSDKSLKRFAKATHLLEHRPQNGETAGDFAFGVLAQIEMNTFLRTQWSLVYDLEKGHVEFKTKDQPSRKSLDLSSFDFSCATPALMMDIHQQEPGDAAARLTVATFEANKALVDQNWVLLGSKLRKLAAEYPTTHTECTLPEALP